MKRFYGRICALMCALMCLMPGAGMQEAPHPMIAAGEEVLVETPQERINLLMAGIDFGIRGYRGSLSSKKRALEDCHTDAMIVVSIDKESGEVDLISLPRDLVAYVPGVRGMYKINGAVNCAQTIEEGLERACAAAGQILGGIEITHYAAVDMGAMLALCDAVGGLEFDMDMAYTGSSGIEYVQGMQTLDGVGIMDYLRARTNATREGTDLGRTGRQRELMLAMLSKVRKEPSLLVKMAAVMLDGEHHVITNLGMTEIFTLAKIAMRLEPEEIGSHVLRGSYGTALGWSFTFIDQEHRRQVIREVFGIEAQELPYVNKGFCDWLEETGMRSARYIGAARQLLEYLKGCEMDEAQRARTQEFAGQTQLVIDCFSEAARTQQFAERKAMEKARTKLREMGEALIEEFCVPQEAATFESGVYWYEDERINEYIYRWE